MESAMIAVRQIDQMLMNAVESGSIPGVVALAADNNGVLYTGAFGSRAIGQVASMELDTIVWLASMTKLITSVAAMQLVEQGRIGLDDSLHELLPELATIQVLENFDAAGVPQLRAPRRPITLRHLLTHTSGFSYRFWNAEMLRFQDVTGVPDLSECKKISLMVPLVSDPGERWEYGISTDWAGQVVERASGRSLNDYFHENIFDPLNMVDTGFVLQPAYRSRLGSLHARHADGSLEALPFEEAPAPPEFFAGGGDVFSTGPDYLRFLRMFLGGGQLDGVRVLQFETEKEMSRNQIGKLTAGVLNTADPFMSNDVEFFPGMDKKWGLACLITPDDAPTGRAAGSLCWAGMFNTYYWIDPVRNVTGVLLTQILPFADPAVLDLFQEFERAVYDGVG